MVWADKRRLRSFYRAGKLQPFLMQAPHHTVMATARSAMTGEVLFVGDVASDEPGGPGKSGGRRSPRPGKRRGLGLALQQIEMRRIEGDRIVLIDAAACFITQATVTALLQRLAGADLVAIAGSGAAIAMTPHCLGWLRRSEAARAATDLVGLWRILQKAGKRNRWRMITLPPVGAGEQPMLDSAGLYAGTIEHKMAAALRLVDAGLGLRDPGRIEIRGNLSFGRNVFIDVNVMIMGDVILEDGVTIGPNCILEDTQIRAGCTIKEFSLLSGALVGPACRVGPFARLRPGTRLGSGCQIGNFVEVKNARFGRNCKINHHCFVGDATLGDEVIMGAGSMTCNYDGTKSNVTRIRNNAFIGSGVMLVAPVTVERNAFVGAGSTVVTNAPANSLTLGRAKQISIKGWKKK